jgi:hypothetical protein
MGMDTLRLELRELQQMCRCEDPMPVHPGAPREETRTGFAPGRHHRTSERRTFCANVRALPLDGRLSPAGGIADDLCEEGVFISSSRQPPPGSLVLLQIYGPQGSKLSLLARVAHNREGIGYGCEFLDVDPQQRADLLALLDSPFRIVH